MSISDYSNNRVNIYNTYRQPIGINFLIEKIESIYKDEDNTTINILDCGCGSGKYTQYLSNYDYSITSIDNNDNMLNSLNNWIKNNNITNVSTKKVNLMENIDLPENNFDIIIINQVVHHFNDDTEDFKYLSKLFNNLYKILKPDGILSLNTSSYEQHRFGMWWGYLIEPQLKEYCKRYCSIDKLINISNNNNFKLIEQHKCKEPFIGNSYYNPHFVLDEKIRKTDTLWEYVDDNVYNNIKNILKEVELQKLFDKHNLLNKFGQSSFFIFKKNIF